MPSDVTLQDVARRAGVSIATASRAFNGSATRTVGEDLRRRVMTAAEELGYAPNAYAQAMARGRTNIVGLIVHDIADPYFSTVASAIMREAEQQGLLVTIAGTMRRASREIDYVETFRRHWARVVIIVGSRIEDPEGDDRLARELAGFEAGGGRAVLVSQPLLPVDTVNIDNEAGARALAVALCELGHRRFAVLSGPDSLLTSRDRLTGFKAGLAAQGCPLADQLLVRDDFTREGGYAAMSRLLETKPDITCVFAVNDVMAVGAMAALRDAGIDLPGSMAVAGFDDIITLRDVTPSLTTVRIPLQDIGSMALQLAMDDGAGRPRRRRVTGEVVIRASTPRIGP